MVIRKKKITIHDVAKLAEVSYQTVSRVLNENSNVADKTRKRVLHAMSELEYSPNKVAQMLTTSRSSTLELILVDIKHGGNLADSTQNMAHVAKDAGYSLLVSETDVRGLRAALDHAASRLVDGVILYAPSLHISDADLLKLCNGIPVVRRDYVPDSRLAWVGFDQVFATRLAVDHLISSGHRHIAAIPPGADLINGYWRHLAWRETLLKHGLTPGPVYPGDYSIRSAYEAAQSLLKSGQTFTALLVGTDIMAVGALRALREHGLRIPDDVSVVGFDNAEISAYTEPPLTTIDFKFAQQDAVVVKYLIDILADTEMGLHQRILMPDLVVRESTRSI
jgi:LacI family transcriptional regulator